MWHQSNLNSLVSNVTYLSERYKSKIQMQILFRVFKLKTLYTIMIIKYKSGISNFKIHYIFCLFIFIFIVLTKPMFHSTVVSFINYNNCLGLDKTQDVCDYCPFIFNYEIWEHYKYYW